MTPRKGPGRWLATVLRGLIGAAALAGAPVSARAADVVVPGSTDFPESIAATQDGTLYFSSFAGGRIFRAAPGQAQASVFVPPGANGLSSVLGLLADPASDTLYACSPDMSWAGITVPSGDGVGALKTFALATGTAKASFPLPVSFFHRHRTMCNDIALGRDGAVYVTDSLAGHVLRLAHGATELSIWASDPRWAEQGVQLDGIAVPADGSVVVDTFDGGGLYRIAANPDGSAGAVTKLQVSRPLHHPDALRTLGPDSLLLIEGEGGGTLDRVTLRDDTAQIETIKGGFQGPVSVAPIGDTAYVLDVPLSFLFDRDKRGHAPPFTAFAVELPR